MDFIYVNSSDISAVAVNDNNLVIKFKNGSVYEYVNAASEYENILNASSKGKYFHQFIRNKHSCVRII